MSKKNKLSITLLGLLAFAVVAYFVFPFFRNDTNSTSSEGLRIFRVESFQENTGWAYRIYQDSVPSIEQKFIPGIQGQVSFKTEAEALKTGELVKNKLEAGIFPPTVSMHELDSLGITY